MVSRFLISLSGGGFRSSLFNAGVLRVLNEMGHLVPIESPTEKNIVVNAVSGGTIPAALWDRYLRSDTYYTAPKSLLPEQELLKLVENSPKLMGRFNWHLRGWGVGAQRAWYRYLKSWWDEIDWTEDRWKLVGDVRTLTRPGISQYLPTFLFQSLEFNQGHVFAFQNGKYFVPKKSFFRKGAFIDFAGTEFPIVHGILSATAFPGFFSSVKVRGHSLIDSGLIDNQAILNFLPMLRGGEDIRLNGEDSWFLSDAGRSMSVQGGTEDDLGAGNPTVARLGPLDRVFRLTGDLAQPKVLDVILGLVSEGLGTDVVGVNMSFSGHDDPFWIVGPRVKSATDSARYPTTLAGINKDDAIAMVAHGALCAAVALEMPVSDQISLVDRLLELGGIRGDRPRPVWF